MYQAGTILKKIKKEWVTNKNNCLEDGLVDVGSAMKYLLEQAKVSVEKKRALKGECKKMIIDILVKLQENTPLGHTIIRNFLALVPINVVHKIDNCSIRFGELADFLYTLNKTTTETSDNSKIQFDDLLEIAKYEHREAFLKFDYKKGRLDEFIWPLLTRLINNKELYTVCKVIFVLSHGQSLTERGFSITKEVK